MTILTSVVGKGTEMNRLLTVAYNHNVLEIQLITAIKFNRSYLLSVFQVLTLQVRFPSTGKLYALHCSWLKSPDTDRWKPQKMHKPKLHASPYPEAFILSSKKLEQRGCCTGEVSEKLKTAVSLDEETYIQEPVHVTLTRLGRVSRRERRSCQERMGGIISVA